jgi:hypothetical protein
MMLKPLKKAGMPSLLEGVYGIKLAPFAGEVLLENAVVMNEGVVDKDANGTFVYHGSTMISFKIGTIPKNQIAKERWNKMLIEGLRRSVPFKVRLLRMARSAAEVKCEPYLPQTFTTELEFKIEEDSLLVDIDILGCLAEPLKDEKGGMGHNNR